VAIAHSRLTAQGQISVPADIRKRLGIGPGSVIEWSEEDDRIVVRRSGKYTSRDIRLALFGSALPELHKVEEYKPGIRRHLAKHWPERS